MPRGDGTGPRVMGSMTGRAAGFCAGFGVPGSMSAMPGRAFGLGAGFGVGRGFGGGGRGWRNRFYATGRPGWTRFGRYAALYANPMPYPNADPETEKQALRNQADILESELNLIRKRLDEMEKGAAA